MTRRLATFLTADVVSYWALQADYQRRAFVKLNRLVRSRIGSEERSSDPTRRRAASSAIQTSTRRAANFRFPAHRASAAGCASALRVTGRARDGALKHAPLSYRMDAESARICFSIKSMV